MYVARNTRRTSQSRLAMHDIASIDCVKELGKPAKRLRVQVPSFKQSGVVCPGVKRGGTDKPMRVTEAGLSDLSAAMYSLYLYLAWHGRRRSGASTSLANLKQAT